MIAQLHWQNPQKPEQTEWILQFETDMHKTDEALHLWMREQFERRVSTCPNGWIPMVCWGDHPAFVKAAT